MNKLFLQKYYNLFIMKKILLLAVISMAITFVSCQRTKSDSGNNNTVTNQPITKNIPTIIGDWYGVKYSNVETSIESLLAFPIAVGAPNHCYLLSYISFKEDGRLSLFGGVPNMYLPAKFKYKYVDKGDYYDITDEFDRKEDIVLQISELTDSSCVVRYNSANMDIYVAYSRKPEERRKYFERYFSDKLKDEYKESNEWKIDKEMYQMDL